MLTLKKQKTTLLFLSSFLGHIHTVKNPKKFNEPKISPDSKN
jgi:hypothetical protein